MAKWTRVGEIPKKIPVNFVVDSDKYPVLAAWIYSFPHGEMGKTVRDILNAHALAAEGGGVGADVPRRGAGGSVTATAVDFQPPAGFARGAGSGNGGRGDVRPHEGQSGAIVLNTDPPGGDSDQPSGMDAGTANTLNQLDQGF